PSRDAAEQNKMPRSVLRSLMRDGGDLLECRLRRRSSALDVRQLPRLEELARRLHDRRQRHIGAGRDEVLRARWAAGVLSCNFGQDGVDILGMADRDAFAAPRWPGSGAADQHRNDRPIGTLAMVGAKVAGLGEDLIERGTRQTAVALKLRDYDGCALQYDQIDAAKVVGQLVLKDRGIGARERVAIRELPTLLLENGYVRSPRALLLRTRVANKVDQSANYSRRRRPVECRQVRSPAAAIVVVRAHGAEE